MKIFNLFSLRIILIYILEQMSIHADIHEKMYQSPASASSMELWIM